jgi:uncharacterized protein (DUF427 family)
MKRSFDDAKEENSSSSTDAAESAFKKSPLNNAHQNASNLETATSSVDDTKTSTPPTTAMTEVQAIWNGEIIASTNIYEYVEGNVYFPIASVNQERIVSNDAFGTTFCHWKGHCNYYNIVANNQTLSAAMYEYKKPYLQASRILDHVAFSKEVEIIGIDSSIDTLGYVEPELEHEGEFSKDYACSDGKVGWEVLCYFLRHPPQYHHSRMRNFYKMTFWRYHNSVHKYPHNYYTGIKGISELKELWKHREVQRYVKEYHWTLEYDSVYSWERHDGCECTDYNYPYHCTCVRPTKLEPVLVQAKGPWVNLFSRNQKCYAEDSSSSDGYASNSSEWPTVLEPWCGSYEKYKQNRRTNTCLDSIKVTRRALLDRIFENKPEWDTKGYYEVAYGDGGCLCGDCPCCEMATQYVSCDFGSCGTCHTNLDKCTCNNTEIKYSCNGMEEEE